MKGIEFLKAAYAVAWVTYLGYLGYMLARFRRLQQETKELEKPQ